MVATNIHWTESPFEMGGWQFAKSEAALRESMKEYDVEITGVGPLIELCGYEGHIYDFKAKEKAKVK